MNGVFGLLNQPLPTGVIILIGLGILWFRVRDINKCVTELKSSCNERLKWCLNHFEDKQ